PYAEPQPQPGAESPVWPGLGDHHESEGHHEAEGRPNSDLWSGSDHDYDRDHDHDHDYAAPCAAWPEPADQPEPGPAGEETAEARGTDGEAGPAEHEIGQP
ncbi:MAG: hypothetical protein ACRDRJ_21085, partial [Streptosporangiaceae bacterium]